MWYSVKKILYECKVVSPMILRGAEQNSEELIIRVPSVKGAMRYWWRIINRERSTEMLRKLEGNIFGCIGDNGGSIKSNVSIRSWFDNEPNIKKTKVFFYKRPHKENVRLNCILPGNKFYVQMIVNDNLYTAINEEDNGKKRIKVEDEVQLSFEALELLGGLGARTRRGFGAFKILKKVVNGKEVIINTNDTYSTIRKLVNPSNEITRLHIKEIQLLSSLPNNYESALTAIDKVAHEMRENAKDDDSKYKISLALGDMRGKKLEKKKEKANCVKGAVGTASPLIISLAALKNKLRVVVTIVGEEDNEEILKIQREFIKRLQEEICPKNIYSYIQ